MSDFQKAIIEFFNDYNRLICGMYDDDPEEKDRLINISMEMSDLLYRAGYLKDKEA